MFMKKIVLFLIACMIVLSTVEVVLAAKQKFGGKERGKYSLGGLRSGLTRYSLEECIPNCNLKCGNEGDGCGNTCSIQQVNSFCKVGNKEGGCDDRGNCITESNPLSVKLSNRVQLSSRVALR